MFRAVAGRDPSAARHRLLVALRDAGGGSRAQLARVTGLAPSTITAVVNSLLAEGAIVEGPEVGEPDRRPGPRSKRLTLSLTLGTVAGVDFGFRTVRVLITDMSGRRLAFDSAPLAENYDAKTGLTVAAELLLRVVSQSALRMPAIAGVALPGPIDLEQQQVVSSGILPGWAGCDAKYISRVVGVQCVVENDGNLAALGEHLFGAGRGVSNTLTVKFHSGIGCGLILNNRLVSGSRGGAGEIGHIEIDERGPLCRCGKRGCLDTFAAVQPVLAALRPQHEITTVNELVTILKAGDLGAQRVVRDAAHMVGRVIASACLLTAPDRVIIVGSLAQAGPAVLEPIDEELRRHMMPYAQATPDVVLGNLGNAHTALGAVALGLRTLGWLE
jgi:predicted NBD/HSP70 family sugar kinase